VGLRVATPDYLKTIGVPLVAGRAFHDSDDQGAPPVVIINQALASHYWGRENPIGQMLTFEDSKRWFTVIGVVGNARHRLDAEPSDEVYQPLFQRVFLGATFAARTRLTQAEVATRVRAVVNRIDPEQPVDTFRTLEDLRSQALAPPRLSAMLIGLFAALALVVTAVGLGGVMGYSVSQRLREFGVRLALGAERRDLLGLVLKQGFWLVGVGLAIGLFAAVALARQLSGLLYGVTASDIGTFVSASVVIVAVGLCACLLPARRAARVDPLLALRGQ
jgi:putative ABC transport system permease protein